MVHHVYDECIHHHGCSDKTCPIHSEFNAHVRDSHHWLKPMLPAPDPKYTFRCTCECHQGFRRKNDCASYCCEKKRIELTPVGGTSICLCLCHTEINVECKGSVTCCKQFCYKGETDEEPLDIEPTDVFPWSSTVGIRRRTMADTMHLHMTVEGPPLGVDLFHIILFKCDKEYPRDPMAKADAKLKVCTKCKGIVWPNMIFKPEDVIRAAKDASIGVGGKVEVRVHSWRKASKCFKKGGREELVAV